MTLLERCKELTAGVARRTALKQEAAKAEVFQTRAQDIRGLNEEIRGALAKIQVLRAHQIAIPRAKDVGAALERLSSYQRALAEDAATSGPAHGHAKRSLDSVRKSIMEAAQTALDRVIKEIPGLEEQFLKLVELNPAYRDQVNQIRTIRTELQRTSRQATLEPAALSRFLEQRELLHQHVNRLDPSDFPKEVLAFFKAARTGGATIEKWTDLVRDWLRARDQLGHIRITIVD